MARKKKQEEESGGNAPWMNTFADLMNLLLCFFVLLFSMSTVDAEKYEAVVASMVNKINIFPQGGAAVGEGAFVSSGTDQLVQISEFFAEFKESGNPTEAEREGEEKKTGETGYTPEEDLDEKKIIEEHKQKMFDEQKEKTENIYDEIMGALEKYKLTDLVAVNMDENYQYVQLVIKGAVLFDSGKAEIKKDNIKIVDKLGDLLRIYKDHEIEILGHTDNVPIHNSTYRSNFELSQARAYAVYDYLYNVKKNFDPNKLKVSGRGEFEPIVKNDTLENMAKNRRVEIRIDSVKSESSVR